MNDIRFFVLLLGFLTLSYAGSAQVQSTPVSDPKALALAFQSLTAITGGASIGDVTLMANVTSMAGSDLQTGTATLRAKGFLEGRIDLNLSGGQRSEVRNNSGGLLRGAWSGTSAIAHSVALHNCLTDGSWFFVPLSSLSAALSNSNVILSYLGPVSSGGRTFEHLQSYLYVAGLPVVAQLSTMDFYLDSTTLLPIVVSFNIHPDNDFGTNIPVEIDFSQYQAINGVQVPRHIQRFVQGTVVLDLGITSAAFNSGLSDTLFSIP